MLQHSPSDEFGIFWNLEPGTGCQRSCGCPIPQRAQSQLGPGLEQPSQSGRCPCPSGRVWHEMSFKVPPTQNNVGFFHWGGGSPFFYKHPHTTSVLQVLYSKQGHKQAAPANSSWKHCTSTRHLPSLCAHPSFSSVTQLHLHWYFYFHFPVSPHQSVCPKSKALIFFPNIL